MCSALITPSASRRNACTSDSQSLRLAAASLISRQYSSFNPLTCILGVGEAWLRLTAEIKLEASTGAVGVAALAGIQCEVACCRILWTQGNHACWACQHRYQGRVLQPSHLWSHILLVTELFGF